MSAGYEDQYDLAAEVAGEHAGGQDVGEHLAACTECREEVESLREMRQVLVALPPEALLDGPPDDADLVLQRTLRQMRTESGKSQGRARLRVVSAAAAVLVAAVGAGVLVGRAAGDGSAAPVAAPPQTAAPQTAAPGTRFASATGPGGTRMTVGVTPAAGWVRVNASVTGVPPRQNCWLVVVGKDGRRAIAGGWLTPANAETAGVNLSGSAVVDPAQVASVAVENTDGHQFVSVPL
jgi:hypothetical protein